MKSFLLIISVMLLAVFMVCSQAYASPNPEGTKETIETTPEAQPKAVPKSDEKEYDWLEVRVSLAWQSDDNVVLLNNNAALVPDYDANKIVTTVTLRATPIKTTSWKFGAQYDFYNAGHSDVDYMEIQTHSLLFFGIYSNSPSYLYFPLSTNLYRLDHSTYLSTLRFAPTYYYEQSNRWLLTLSLSAEILDYRRDADRDYDGIDYIFSVSETFLLNRKSWLKATASYNYLKAHADYLSYAGPKFMLSYDTPIIFDIAATFSASYHYRDYREENPTTLVARLDKRTVFDVYLVRPIKWGISAFARYTYIENNSDEKNFDYSRNIITLGLEWNY